MFCVIYQELSQLNRAIIKRSYKLLSWHVAVLCRMMTMKHSIVTIHILLPVESLFGKLGTLKGSRGWRRRRGGRNES